MRAYLVLGKKLNLLWSTFCVIGQLFIFAIGPILTNNLAKQSRWSRLLKLTWQFLANFLRLFIQTSDHTACRCRYNDLPKIDFCEKQFFALISFGNESFPRPPFIHSNSKLPINLHLVGEGAMDQWLCGMLDDQEVLSLKPSSRYKIAYFCIHLLYKVLLLFEMTEINEKEAGMAQFKILTSSSNFFRKSFWQKSINSSFLFENFWRSISFSF